VSDLFVSFVGQSSTGDTLFGNTIMPYPKIAGCSFVRALEDTLEQRLREEEMKWRLHTIVVLYWRRMEDDFWSDYDKGDG